MATYLELARTTRLLCGMQGTGPVSVVDAQGIEEALVRFVRDAYVDVQSLREDFKWMEVSDTFDTTATQSTYTFLDIFLTDTPAFKKWQKGSFIIEDATGNKNYLKEMSRDALEQKYLNSTTTKVPSEYAIEPGTNSIIMKPIPDAIYTVSFRYQRSPEILSTDAQIPILPLHFHNLIVYKAVEKMAVFLSSPETYRQYATEATKMIGQLMRMDLPKMRMVAGSLV